MSPRAAASYATFRDSPSTLPAFGTVVVGGVRISRTCSAVIAVTVLQLLNRFEDALLYLTLRVVNRFDFALFVPYDPVMANSLKSMFPALGRILNVSPDALYAYQRAFVAAGILDSTPGRGPGSGVRASPETVAQFLIGLLTNASAEENAGLARSLGNARSAHGECPLTGAKRFRDALARVLASKALAGRVREVVLGVTQGQAFIRYDGTPASEGPERWAADRPKSSLFVGTSPKRTPLQFTALIPSDTLLSLAKETSQ
jgi:hypothetical protein